MVIVGGGVIGCAVAFYAAKRGLRVTLIDQPKRGRATSASAGGLWPVGESVGLGCGVIFHRTLAANSRLSEDSQAPRLLPACFFEFSIRSNAMFPRLAEELVETTGVDVEWDRSSLLYVMFDEDDLAFARTIENSYPGSERQVDRLTPGEVARCEPEVARTNVGAMLFHGDDQVNPYRLADALRAGAQAHGARFLPQTNVVGLSVQSGRITGVETSEGLIPCERVVNAAGAWAAQVGRMAGVELPVCPVRGQILGTESLPKRLNACLSTADCYLAQKRHGEIIIGSTTEDVGFETGVTVAALRTLSAGAIRAVPSLDEVRLKRAWSGLRPGTPDQLPILGPVEGLDGYLNACGHFRTGILNAPLTGLLIAEMAAGAPPSIAIEPFLLARFASATAARD
jgi:hydrogen cyanide synthase HcnC